jgi:hypothetical protein
MHEILRNIGDFNDLAFFNLFAYFIRLGQISDLNRHQRHQKTGRLMRGKLQAFSRAKTGNDVSTLLIQSRLARVAHGYSERKEIQGALDALQLTDRS